jgi:hypothetical protein
VLPWPWIAVAILQCIDPGEVTPDNVESYLERYPYDTVLYRRGFVRHCVFRLLRDRGIADTLTAALRTF